MFDRFRHHLEERTQMSRGGKYVLWGALLLSTTVNGYQILSHRAAMEPAQAQDLPEVAPYVYTRADLDSGYAGHRIEVDQYDPRRQFYLTYIGNDTSGPIVNIYVSRDGGQHWADVERPAVNGLNKTRDAQIVGASFAPGPPDTDIILHAPGSAFVVEYTDTNKSASQATIELGIAGAQGVEIVDIESAQGTFTDDPGSWKPDGNGGYIFSIPVTGKSGNQTLTLDEPYYNR